MSEHEQDSKTEEPTGKQREKFRKEGQIAKGRDLPSLVSLFAGTASLIVAWPIISGALRGFATDVLSRMNASNEISTVMLLAGKAILFSVAPVALTVMLLGIVAEVSQVGWNWTWKPLMPKFKKFNPLPQIPKLIFSANTIIELLKSMAKVTIIGFFAVRVLMDELTGSGRLAGLSPGMLLHKLGFMCLRIVIHVGLALIVIARPRLRRLPFHAPRVTTTSCP